MRPSKESGLHKQKGVVAIEFLLTIIFVLIMVFFAFELMMFMYSYSVVASAAKEGVRYAVVHGCGTDAATCSGLCTPACADTTGTNVSDQVKGYAKLTFHDISALNPVVTYPDGAATSPNRVRVVISYAYKPYFNLGW